jgi:histidine triad (HIT) family protein
MTSKCLFCRIVQKEIPAEILFENNHVVAFADIHPQAPAHALLIPKKHFENLMAVPPEDTAVIAEIHRAAQELAKKLGVQESGFRLVVNNGLNAGQSVNHLHYHLLGGRRLAWPPG